MTKLLTTGNPKITKGEKKGYWTAVLHLAPHKLSGFNVCGGATPGCIKGCLNIAGRGGIAIGGVLSYDDIALGTRTNAVQQARIARTRRLFNDRAGFMADLVKEIRLFIRRAKRAGFKPAIRLNGTSDIRWEASAFHVDGKPIMDLFPDVPFYDYTKLANRRGLPANYTLTFSLADGNEQQAREALRNGLNVAAVFRSPADRAGFMAEGFMGAPVIDGDETDLRFLDPKGVIVGLYAKGAAKRDQSGFVVDYAPALKLAA